MRGLPQKQNARRADKIKLCGNLRRYKKIVKKTYIILVNLYKKTPLLSFRTTKAELSVVPLCIIVIIANYNHLLLSTQNILCRFFIIICLFNFWIKFSLNSFFCNVKITSLPTFYALPDSVCSAGCSWVISQKSFCRFTPTNDSLNSGCFVTYPFHRISYIYVFINLFFIHNVLHFFVLNFKIIFQQLYWFFRVFFMHIYKIFVNNILFCSIYNMHLHYCKNDHWTSAWYYASLFHRQCLYS